MDQAHGFKPVKKMRLEEAVRCVSILDAALAALQMIHPVAACVLQLGGQTSRNPALVYLASAYPRFGKVADVLPKAVGRRHELKAARRQLLVRACLVDLEVIVVASLPIKKEVAERGVI